MIYTMEASRAKMEQGNSRPCQSMHVVDNSRVDKTGRSQYLTRRKGLKSHPGQWVQQGGLGEVTGFSLRYD